VTSDDLPPVINAMICATVTSGADGFKGKRPNTKGIRASCTGNITEIRIMN